MTKTPSELSDHVVQLALAFNVQIEWHDLPPDLAAAGTMQSGPGLPVSQRRSFVLLPRVQDETTYAVALHELGHCLHPLGRVHRIEGSAHFRATGQYSSFNDLRLLLLAERSAWEWAHHYALEWTPVMTYVEDWALSEYKRMAREKYGMKV